MFYESQPLKSIECLNAADAVMRLAARTKKGGPLPLPPAFNALTWQENGKRYILCSDTNCNMADWFETAMLEADGENAAFFQTESFTLGFYKDAGKFLKEVKENVLKPFIKRPASIILDREPEDQIAGFSCGCCGGFFTDNVKKQLAFDQDSGYGICPSCESKHYS